ncbi:MAG: peptidase M14, partial [Bacteroidetes bacterium]|nr:peptidase M14 [Bacteroidota bacterium]
MRCSDSDRRLSLLPWLALILLMAPRWTSAQPTFEPAGDWEYLLSAAERSDFQATTRYDDVFAFVEGVTTMSADLHRARMGYTLEGREIPLVVAGKGLAGSTPEAVRASEKIRVFILANIHAGEVCGKEAMLTLLRHMAAGQYDGWLDDLVLIVAPIYNADGNERVQMAHRGVQNGPHAGMGQRENAQGLDLNRDHLKLVSPEATSLIQILQAYDPHVLIDLHTTNGTKHGFHLTYSPPLHP